MIASRIKLWGIGKQQVSFQGICDLVTIDNPYLQMQLRTRPGRSTPAWSGVTQVALLWKPTNTILFRFVKNHRMDSPGINNLLNYADVVEYTKFENSLMPGRFIHKFQFKMASTDNFIRVEELPYGLHNIDVLGFGATFGGSSGFIGDWKRWSQTPRIVFRDNTLPENIDAIALAKSWSVRTDESFLYLPSDLCTSEANCGPGEEIECVEDDGFDMSQRLSENSCALGCDGIEDTLMRTFCKEDVRLTGLQEIACSNSYRDPVVSKSSVKQCPSDCAGDTTTDQFPIQSLGGEQYGCSWADIDPTEKERRCQIPEIALNCCETCCSSCRGDAAGNEKFFIKELNKNRSCEWAARKHPASRCSIRTVQLQCCETCSRAVPSSAPSQAPSSTISYFPSQTTSPSIFPSTKMSSVPSIFASVFPSSSPSILDTTNPSIEISSKPSFILTDKPTKLPTHSPTRTPSNNPSSNPTEQQSSFPTFEFSNSPSHFPSTHFSQWPSFLPTTKPSQSPSDFTVCSPSELTGSTIFFQFANICWRIQLFNNGTLDADVRNLGCSANDFVASGTLSKFKKVDGIIAEFEEGKIGWSGNFKFKENPLVSDVTASITSMLINSYFFEADLFFPTCTKAPSLVPSSIQSEIPSNMPSDVSVIVEGRVYYFYRSNNKTCYKVEVKEGGVFSYDESINKSSGCNSETYSQSFNNIDISFYSQTNGMNVYFIGTSETHRSGVFMFKKSERSSLYVRILSWTKDKFEIEVFLPK